MKSYLRFLSRNRLYTIIEVVGMAVAIAFVVFIGSFVIKEHNTDASIKAQGNIYLGHSERMFFGSATIKEQLDGKFPEVESVCRILCPHTFGGVKMMMSAGEYNDRQKALIADENFFAFFPFTLDSGTSESVLREKNSVAISRSCARRLFGSQDPIGKSIKIDVNGKEAILSVTGIFSDFRNTIFYSPEIIYRIDLLSELDGSLTGNGNGSASIFFKIKEDTDLQALEDRMESIVSKEDLLYQFKLFKEFKLTPFSKISSCKVEYFYPFEGIVDAEFIKLFTAAGVFLLLFAVLNYISLTVAQTGFRAKEMASRRLLGTQRWGIVARYIAEASLLTFMSFAAAIVIVQFVSPYLGELIGKEINPLADMGWGEAVFVLALLVTLSILSGIIPAILVSKYKPIDVVRGNFAKTGKMTLGKILVAFQSGVAFITLVISAVMFVQLKHMSNKPMGYEKDNRICVQGAGKASDYHIDELKQLACVEKVGWMQFEPMTLGTTGQGFSINGTPQNIDMYFLDQAAFEIIGFEVLRKNGEPTDMNAWLPESTMRALGLDYNCTEIKIDNDGFIPVCGIIKDYQKGDANNKKSSDFLNLAWIKEMKTEDDFRILRMLAVKVSGDEDKAADEIKAFYKKLGFSEEEISVQTFNEMNSNLYDFENKNMQLLAIFTGLTLLLTALALFAMSTYYAKQHAKEAALRRVMGCGKAQLFVETASGFLKSVGWSILIALPFAWLLSDEWLEGYSYRIDNPPMVYLIAVAIMAAIALISICWQIMKLINTNPVKSLKNE